MTEFRDGIFSTSAPMAPYGALKTSYSDGALGASASLPPEVSALLVPGCQSRCDAVGKAYRWPKIKIKKCKTHCFYMPQQWSQLMSKQYQEAVASGLIAAPSKLPRPLVEGGAATRRKTAPSAAGSVASEMGLFASVIGSVIVGAIVIVFTFGVGSGKPPVPKQHFVSAAEREAEQARKKRLEKQWQKSKEETDRRLRRLGIRPA